MNTRKYILSPCGTSLLTNQAQNNEERQLVFKYANEKSKDTIPEADRNRLAALIETVSLKIDKADYQDAAIFSAELNGIIKIYNNVIPNTSDDVHCLLSTDTWLGEETSKLVKQWLQFKNHRLIIIVYRHTDLQTKDMLPFQLSLSELIKKLSEELPGYSQRGYKVIFNLTGGFKSVQGFLQSVANFYADETVYIFETSSELLRIPRLPVRMDFITTVQENITAFRRMAIGLPSKTSQGIPETLLLSMEGKTILSPWGELVWEQSRKEIYPKSLQPSPSEKIQYGWQFEKDAKLLPPDRLEIINHRIDQLNKHLCDKIYNPASLDFKQLKNPVKNSTHEMDAWADADARRIFGHFENDIFVLDRLDKGIH